MGWKLERVYQDQYYRIDKTIFCLVQEERKPFHGDLYQILYYGDKETVECRTFGLWIEKKKHQISKFGTWWLLYSANSEFKSQRLLSAMSWTLTKFLSPWCIRIEFFITYKLHWINASSKEININVSKNKKDLKYLGGNT